MGINLAHFRCQQLEVERSGRGSIHTNRDIPRPNVYVFANHSDWKNCLPGRNLRDILFFSLVSKIFLLKSEIL